MSREYVKRRKAEIRAERRAAALADPKFKGRPTKMCRKCGRVLLLTAFYYQPAGKFHVNSRCKTCIKLIRYLRYRAEEKLPGSRTYKRRDPALQNWD